MHFLQSRTQFFAFFARPSVRVLRIAATAIHAGLASWMSFGTYGRRYLDSPAVFAGTTVAAAAISVGFIACVRWGWPFDLWTSVFFYMFLCWLVAGISACALWQVKFIARAAELLPVKLFMSALLFFAVQFARIEAAQHLSADFPIDPNQLPYGLAFGTTLAFIGIVSLALLSVLFACGVIICILLFAGSKRSSEHGEAGAILMLLTILLVLPLDVASVAGQALGLSSKTDILMVRVAAETDFSDHSLCDGLRPSERVVRLGSQGDRGIAAPFGRFPEKPFIRVSAAEIKAILPAASEFHAVNCNVVHEATTVPPAATARHAQPSGAGKQ